MCSYGPCFTEQRGLLKTWKLSKSWRIINITMLPRAPWSCNYKKTVAGTVLQISTNRNNHQ